MENGFITIHRKLLKWGWYQKSEMVHLFLHFLLLANHEPGIWQGQRIERGQFITGRNNLSKDTGISPQKIRTCIKKLKSTNEITIKSTNKYSLITIVKYSEYQDKKEKSTSKLTSKSTNNQPTTNQQLTTNNNNKQLNNDNNKESRNFVPPSIQEVTNYCIERKNSVNPQKFVDFYESKGWLIGKNKMKSWQAAVRTWEGRENPQEENPIKQQEKKLYEEQFYNEHGFYPPK